MEKTIAKKIREANPSPYQTAAKMFNASYIYVSQIASGVRTPTKGKGKLIKEYLEQQIQHLKINNNMKASNLTKFELEQMIGEQFRITAYDKKENERITVFGGDSACEDHYDEEYMEHMLVQFKEMTQEALDILEYL